ncbi:hypothetical protein SPAR_12498, partial [Streptomyces sparsogenes DSM 40356]
MRDDDELAREAARLLSPLRGLEPGPGAPG